MTTQKKSTYLWQIIRGTNMPTPGARVPVGQGEYLLTWTGTDMHHFAHDVATPISNQRDELLAALLIARDHIDMNALEISHRNDAERIRAAIAKAEGTTP